MSKSSQSPVIYAAHSVTGRVRTHNEDALICRPELGLWALADGMGGHARGEVASAAALDGLVSAVEQGRDLRTAVQMAHAAVLAAAAGDHERAGMGSTLVAVKLDGTAFELTWVGDSRAYRVGIDHVEQLSHDHSWVQAMVDSGQMSRAEARDHPRRNLILQCLGQGEPPEADVQRVCLGPDELLLLCSDGLTAELDDDEIQRCCAEAASLESMVEELIGLANGHGGRDNITCIVLAFGPPADDGDGVAPAPGLLRKLFNFR